MEQIINELATAVGAAVATALLGIIELGRRALLAEIARRTVIGAVERGAGLALEAERAGASPQQAVVAGLSYVEKAVPDAISRTGSMPHLDAMVKGAIGVLRAHQGSR